MAKANPANKPATPEVKETPKATKAVAKKVTKAVTKEVTKPEVVKKNQIIRETKLSNGKVSELVVTKH